MSGTELALWIVLGVLFTIWYCVDKYYDWQRDKFEMLREDAEKERNK
jgi:hypothetical protein